MISRYMEAFPLSVRVIFVFRQKSVKCFYGGLILNLLILTKQHFLA